MANETVRFATDLYTDSGGYLISGSCYAGHFIGDPTDGALRFTNIDVPKNTVFDFAELIYVFGSAGDPGDWDVRIRGIDQDNTGAFNSGTFSRPKTTEYKSYETSEPIVDEVQVMDVKEIMEAIVARGGWVSGNALGFIIDDRGSDDDVYGRASSANSYLVYRVAAEPNQTPTPKTVNTAAFNTSDYGIKVSKAGHNVLTASDENLHFTSNKDYTRVIAEGQVSVTAGVTLNIAHGQSSPPHVVAFVRSNGKSFQIPRLLGGAVDPVGGGVESYMEVTNTHIKFDVLNVSADVYYYITENDLP